MLETCASLAQLEEFVGRVCRDPEAHVVVVQMGEVSGIGVLLLQYAEEQSQLAGLFLKVFL